jgi:hypothetical protein
MQTVFEVQWTIYEAWMALLWSATDYGILVDVDVLLSL